ncbi:hypothetical protein [Vibrio bathopelagicus]
MKKYVLVSAILDLQLENTLSEPILIRPDTYLTNNPQHIKQYISSNQYMIMGTLEGKFLFNGSPVAFRECVAAGEDESKVALVDFLRDVLGFLMSTWLIKDNSANIEQGFVFSQYDTFVHSNSLSYYFTQHDSTNYSTMLTNEELNKASDICMTNFKGIRTSDEPKLTMSQKQVGRVTVSNSFLQQARSSADIGVKIANYCSYFESLLSASSAELSHQLAERAAFLLKETPEERYEHFKATKKAYGVRSKIVHGDTLSNKQLESLNSISLHCDQVARELLTLVTSNSDFQVAVNDSNNQVLDEYLVKKIFGIE